MDRFNHYYAQQGIDMTIPLFQSPSNKEPLPCLFEEDTSIPNCSKSGCGKSATHIASDIGSESYLCSEHAEVFNNRRINLSKEFYFCLPFDKVAEIDSVHLQSIQNLSKDDATRFFLQVMKKYQQEAMTKFGEDTILVWLLQIRGCIHCDYRVSVDILTMEEFNKEYLLGREDMKDMEGLRDSGFNSDKYSFLLLSEPQVYALLRRECSTVHLDYRSYSMEIEEGRYEVSHSVNRSKRNYIAMKSIQVISLVLITGSVMMVIVGANCISPYIHSNGTIIEWCPNFPASLSILIIGAITFLSIFGMAALQQETNLFRRSESERG